MLFRSHPVALALLRQAALLGVAGVAAPSANRFGRVSPTTAAHVQDEFGSALRVLDGGPCAVGIESAIVDCTRPRPALLRPGQLARAQIEQALGAPLADVQKFLALKPDAGNINGSPETKATKLLVNSRYDISDIRVLYDSDVRFLEQFAR